MQTWSLRGAPYVFPTAEADAFLTALVPERGEPWIYTDGIGLALDALEIGFGEALALVLEAMPRLDEVTIASKVALDQTLADWVEPLLPPEKRAAWRSPSMYGNPDKQTVGGAAVSFLLRPCAFLGLVTFGERDDTTPTFTSFKRWTGHALDVRPDAQARLVRKFLHCYGPATSAGAGRLAGMLRRASAPSVGDRRRRAGTGVCGRAGAPSSSRPTANASASRPPSPATCCCWARTTPTSTNATARRCNPTRLCNAASGAPWQTPAPSCCAARWWACGQPRKARSWRPPWNSGPMIDRTRLQDLAEAHAAARNLELASTNFA